MRGLYIFFKFQNIAFVLVDIQIMIDFYSQRKDNLNFGTDLSCHNYFKKQVTGKKGLIITFKTNIHNG